LSVMSNNRAKCPVFKASARVENGAHRLDVEVSAEGFRAAGGPKPNISEHFFLTPRKSRPVLGVSGLPCFGGP
jgi:hypothetical protein